MQLIAMLGIVCGLLGVGVSLADRNRNSAIWAFAATLWALAYLTK
jgi:hypothetical protein